jgi:glycerol-3-phosphate dehydrogenase (NAD(P)+)
MQRIGILGAGAWGTALAISARRAGRDVVIRAHEPEVVDAINVRRENPWFLPGMSIDPGIRATTQVAEAVAADAVLIAVPAQFLRAVVRSARLHWPQRAPAVICAKGIEKETRALMSEAVVASLGQEATVATLSGPSFAQEVARGLPTAVTLACRDRSVREALPAALGTPMFRIYSTDDVVGAELGGAVKNVLAIACGIVEGRGLGENARAALITRGLSEMARLAVALGARTQTLTGLSGLGDLVLTCNAQQSRNFSLGVELGRGRRLDDILSERRAVTEGVFSAAAIVGRARSAGVPMPICEAVDHVLNRGAELDVTIAGLLARPFREEAWAD